jgi:hypothetical protein
MSMCSLLEVIKDFSTLKKLDSRLEKDKRLKSRLQLRSPLSNKIMSSKVCWKFSCKAFSLFVTLLLPNAKSLKSFVSKIFTNQMKIPKLLKFLQRKIKSECHRFPSKTCRTSTLLCKYKLYQTKVSKTNLTT